MKSDHISLWASAYMMKYERFVNPQYTYFHHGMYIIYIDVYYLRLKKKLSNFVAKYFCRNFIHCGIPSGGHFFVSSPLQMIYYKIWRNTNVAASIKSQYFNASRDIIIFLIKMQWNCFQLPVCAPTAGATDCCPSWHFRAASMKAAVFASGSNLFMQVKISITQFKN